MNAAIIAIRTMARTMPRGTPTELVIDAAIADLDGDIRWLSAKSGPDEAARAMAARKGGFMGRPWLADKPDWEDQRRDPMAAAVDWLRRMVELRAALANNREAILAEMADRAAEMERVRSQRAAEDAKRPKIHFLGGDADSAAEFYGGGSID